MIRNPPRPVCRKTALILTCYVNGHKRFRAVAIPGEPVTGSPGAGLNLTGARPPGGAGARSSK